MTEFEIYKAALTTWGAEAQTPMVFEEMSELQKELYAEHAGRKVHSAFATVYCLTNYDTTMEENLYRIYTLRDLGYDPYVMVYDKPNAPKEIRRLQRWCNNRIIFKSVPDFYQYDPKRG